MGQRRHIGVSASSTTGTTSYTNIKYAATGTAGNFAVVNAAGEDNDIYFQDQKSTDFSAYYPTRAPTVPCPAPTAYWNAPSPPPTKPQPACPP